MNTQLIFIIAAAISLIVGCISVFGIAMFSADYGLPHWMAGFVAVSSSVFFLVTFADSELGKYRTASNYIPAGMLGITATIWLVIGGVADFVGYIQVPIYVLLSVEPFVKKEKKYA